MALLLLRLVWGVLGPREARFSAFPPDPRAALSHLWSLARGRVESYGSHNPAGAMMAYALWASLSVVIVTGLVMTGAATPMEVARQNAAVDAGDWSVLVTEGAGGDDGSDEGSSDFAQEIHEVAANLMLFLALLHVAGVVLESRAMRRNLVRPMLLGAARHKADE
jgi:cytochrome b